MTHPRVASLAGVLCLLLTMPVMAGDDVVGEYEWKISEEEVDSGNTATVLFSLDISGTLLAGYSLAVCPEEDLVLTEGTIENGSVVADTLFIFHAVSERDEGFTVGAGLNIGAVLDEGDDLEMYTADYTGPEVAMGEKPITLLLEHCVIGVSPSVEATVVLAETLEEFNAEDDELTVTDGSVTINPPPEAPVFLRGDCNDDGRNDIADGIFALSALFNDGSAQPSCIEACNTDDSNNGGAGFDATDAVLIFNYQFLEGPPPAAPFPDCGIDEVDLDETDCESSDCS